MDYARKIALSHKGPHHRTKLKLIDKFGNVNRVNSSNFNSMTLKFSEKFHQRFSHVLYLVTIYPYLMHLYLEFIPILFGRETKLFDLVTGRARNRDSE